MTKTIISMKTNCVVSIAAFLFCISPVLAQQNVVVVLDDSGSMQDSMQGNRNVSKMDAARSALTQVLGSLPDDANVGVLALNSNAEQGFWIAPLGPVNRSAISQQIDGIYAQGGTPLGAAMQTAADALLAAREKQMYGTYRMLVVTDGEASDPELVQLYLPLAQSRGLMVDVIGVSMPGDHSLATQVQSYRRADDPDSFKRALAEVFAETSDDSSDDGESDYDLINGLPDEVAAGALQTLTQLNNKPLSQSTVASKEYAVAQSSPYQQQRRSGGATAGSLLGGLFCCVGTLGLLVAFPVLLLRLGGPKDSSRHRR
jgi:uncharacterized protein YegL